jgi:hypothetical protein
MNTLLSDPSEYLLPAGVELLYETPETIEHVGSIACVASLQSGKIDDTGTSERMDSLALSNAELDSENAQSLI